MDMRYESARSGWCGSTRSSMKTACIAAQSFEGTLHLRLLASAQVEPAHRHLGGNHDEVHARAAEADIEQRRLVVSSLIFCVFRRLSWSGISSMRPGKELVRR